MFYIANIAEIGVLLEDSITVYYSINFRKTYIERQLVTISVGFFPWRFCGLLCTSTCIHVCMHTFIHMYIYIHIYIYVFIYLHVVYNSNYITIYICHLVKHVVFHMKGRDSTQPTRWRMAWVTWCPNRTTSMDRKAVRSSEAPVTQWCMGSDHMIISYPLVN